MVKYLFLDLDNTILDFDKAEYIALRKVLSGVGIEPSDAVCARYHQINRSCWERLERREWSREQVLVGRFEILLTELGIEVSAVHCARTYENLLAIGHYFLPGALETLKTLKGKYRMYLASNGTAKVQYARLESANISHFFEDIFISQEMGADKPSKVFFESCFARIPGFDAEQSMIVGDSLTSDILGGLQSGMKTCWINPKHKPADPRIPADVTLESLAQLPALLDTL